MKIVIIEDERITADDLANTIVELEPNAQIIAILSSVKSAIAYFKNNEAPDLIFSDVQLGDGLSFEIFNAIKISTPVIFCTAYDEYALNAFKTNSVDYILKPSTSKAIAEALSKYRGMQQIFSGGELQYKSILEVLMNRDTPKSASVLVHHKDKIMPVRLDDIAIFYIENENTYLLTFDKKTYFISKNLEELEKTVGNNFFRANRQCLINRKAVVDASHYFSRKLSVNISVPYKDKITVSKEKTPQFLSWLEHVE
ncbi:MAG: LytR/AlgR family response regulator transcription factor [Bacteroidales bacterium]